MTGRLRTDGHETAVQPDDRKVEDQADYQNAHPGNMAIKPRKAKEE